MTNAQESERYTALRERAVAMSSEPSVSDEEREQMISQKATEALAYAGKDPAMARAAIADHALLVKGRSSATVERLERERGLR